MSPVCLYPLVCTLQAWRAQVGPSLGSCPHQGCRGAERPSMDIPRSKLEPCQALKTTANIVSDEPLHFVEWIQCVSSAFVGMTQVCSWTDSRMKFMKRYSVKSRYWVHTAWHTNTYMTTEFFVFAYLFLRSSRFALAKVLWFQLVHFSVLSQGFD